MAAPQVIANNQIVYRGLRNANWRDKKSGNITFKAFLLRPASERFPAEAELSLGLTPESAVNELDEHYGTAALQADGVHALPHGLRVAPDRTGDPAKAEMLGLPLYSTEPQQRGLAIAIGSDLAEIAWFVAVPAAPLN
jgi:hypothetical protein